ncbi:GNAT family N-acetyltransferase [Chelatococcus asaccharovorans]|uniref:Acetyltransferase (GNAT) family protein n=1 Tax=Chelatococcus asaccharovorans TaxID=28210 RepID=A0A2V3U8I2_9HYPH|nr:GNAT family N-acetyltransferase [Chelatococcus asaccharovorans]MBS7705999.1 GNAT family N-acetyltransferase [Chelatococcus asaccharovorans]PXW59020.1 acetyltransferase (GNAT) family protein [Chelatococcus asaccharovorans]
MSDAFPSVVAERAQAEAVSGGAIAVRARLVPKPAPRHFPPAVEGPLGVEQRLLRNMGDYEEAWADLSQRLLQENPFYTQAFAASAAQHLPDGRHVTAVLVWGGGQDERVLLGLFPVILPRAGIVPAAARLWQPPLMAFGVPLVDRDNARAVIAAFLDHLGKRGLRGTAVLFPLLAEDGPFAAALRAVIGQTGRQTRVFGRHRRAILPASRHSDGLVTLQTIRKRKELRRQLRRLEERGTVSFTRASSPVAVRDAVESFLAIEASGWKARAGTAILQHAGAVAFLRTMTRRMAHEGRCEVHLLNIGDRAIAAGIVLRSGSEAFFWKIAYDEAFARFSPGVQLTLALSHAQLDDRTIAYTDSCAIANHPMIDHLWRERLSIVDMLVGTRAGSSVAMRVLGQHEESRRRLRVVAKAVCRRVAGWFARR